MKPFFSTPGGKFVLALIAYFVGLPILILSLPKDALGSLQILLLVGGLGMTALIFWASVGKDGDSPLNILMKCVGVFALMLVLGELTLGGMDFVYFLGHGTLN